MAQLVSYYRIKSGANAGFVVAFGPWPARILKHRGWTPEKRFYQRVATPEEHEWLANCMRFQAYRYDSVDGLLQDECQALQEWPSTFERLKSRLADIGRQA